MPSNSNLKLSLAANKLSRCGAIGRPFAYAPRWLNRTIFSNDIGIGVQIDPSCTFYHCAPGCVIHPDVAIGRNSIISQHVTIGAAWHRRARDGGRPRVGDDVMLGAGCVLLGGFEIGDGAIVGANAVVTKSVPAGCTVAGVPARPIVHGTLLEGES